MPHSHVPSDDISRRGKETIDTVLPERVETEDNIGKRINGVGRWNVAILRFPQR